MADTNKKTTILFVLAVIVMVITVIGVSFALFSFMGSGDVVNTITTGNVAIDYSDSYDINNNPLGKGVVSLENEFPMTDEEALKSMANEMDFTVTATMSGKMDVNYDIGITNLKEGKTLNANYIKVALLDENGYVLGTSTLGEKLSSRKDLMGKYGLIDNYYLASGSFSDEGVHHYKLLVWISSDYEFATETTNNNGTHTSSSISESFSFEVLVIAGQA